MSHTCSMKSKAKQASLAWGVRLLLVAFALGGQLASVSAHMPSSSSNNNNSDTGYQALDIINRSQMGIIRLRGFSGQVHYAVTREGYYVHLVRIINPLIRDRRQLKRPIVFNHGLLESSTIWLVNSKGMKPKRREGLCATLPIDLEAARNSSDSINGPLMLANEHYDVWLMSMRGTEYSLHHDTLDSSAPEFWDYSLDNFALDDVPSVINYIRRQTGAEKVAYAGHSQATFSIFGLLAARPQYAEVIEPVFAVAPVAYMHHTTSITRALFMLELATPQGLHGPVPEMSRRMRFSLASICGKGVIGNMELMCDVMNAMIGGAGMGQRRGYFSHVPFHTSHKVLRHFGQIVTKEKFTMYDHGPEENMRRYGVAEAPTYKPGNIRSRALVLFWTKTDNLSPVADVERFKSELTVPLYRDVFIEREFNHFDLITHDDARYLVFAPMLEVLEEFEALNGVCQASERPAHEDGGHSGHDGHSDHSDLGDHGGNSIGGQGASGSSENELA